MSEDNVMEELEDLKANYRAVVMATARLVEANRADGAIPSATLEVLADAACSGFQALLDARAAAMAANR